MIDHIWRERRAIGARSTIAIGGKAAPRRCSAPRRPRDRTAGESHDRVPGSAGIADEGACSRRWRARCSPRTIPKCRTSCATTSARIRCSSSTRWPQLGEALPAASIEYNRGDQPIGVDGKPEPTGLPIGETIRRIEQPGSWAVLKNIEQHPAYAALLAELLGELSTQIEPQTGRMMMTQGFIFVSSPEAVTPYHFDPEHNILLQLRRAAR